MSQPASSQRAASVETDAFLAGRLDGGVVWLSIKPGSVVDEGASRRGNRVIRDLADRLPARILCDISASHETTAGARKYGASDEAVEVTGRLALLVRSPVARMAGNAFMYARTPPYPTRLFTSEEAAIAWLNEDDG